MAGRCDKLSKRQAQKVVSRIEVEFDHDPRARSPETVPTLGEWLELLIERKKAAGRKPKTINDYISTKKLLIRYFGKDRRLNTITNSTWRSSASNLPSTSCTTLWTAETDSAPSPSVW